MSNTNSNTIQSKGSDVYYGRVKWFNNRAGYGFITIVAGCDGDKLGNEIFSHHSGINVSNEQYKYLMQGEYVEFILASATEGEHEFQAVNISGIAKGKLMCETRAEIKQSRDDNEDSDRGDGRSRGGDHRGGRGGQRVRLMGGGARDGEIWTLVKDNTRNGRGRPQKHREEDDN